MAKRMFSAILYFRTTFFSLSAMPRKAAHISVADADAAPGGAAAVDRAISVLAAFKTGDAALSLGEIAERTLLYKSTVLRLLASLEHARLIHRNADGRYTLGPEIARLYAAYSSSFSQEAAVVPLMEKLVAQTKESASFHVIQGAQRLCLYRVDSPQAVRDHIKTGDLLPLDKGVGGRVLMAFSGARGKLYDEIREKKVASAIGDRAEGVAGISAPVFDATEKLAGAVTLTMPAMRFDRKFEKPLRNAAVEMTRALGGPIHFFG
jgi:DNA-binding IclR family transcriptional regulator